MLAPSAVRFAPAVVQRLAQQRPRNPLARPLPSRAAGRSLSAARGIGFGIQSVSRRSPVIMSAGQAAMAGAEQNCDRMWLSAALHAGGSAAISPLRSCFGRTLSVTRVFANADKKELPVFKMKSYRRPLHWVRNTGAKNTDLGR